MSHIVPALNGRRLWIHQSKPVNLNRELFSRDGLAENFRVEEALHAVDYYNRIPPMMTDRVGLGT